MRRIFACTILTCTIGMAAALALPAAGGAQTGKHPGASQANSNCSCRLRGQDIALGQTVCMNTASGPKLARCELTLNNTSWKIIANSCPLAQMSIVPGR